jgi:outer membrane protein TolC
MRFRTICAMLALGLGGWGQMATARATSLDLAGIRQSIQLSTSNQSSANDRHSIHSSSVVIAQKITPTPVAPETNIKSPNDLNIPQTGGQVQVTGRQAITLQQAIEIAFRNNRQVQVARLTVDRDRQGISAAQAAQAVQVGLTGSLQNQGSPLIIGTQSRLGTSTDSAVQGGLQATYNILSAGRNQSSVRAAEEQVKFDQLDLVRVEQLVRGNVITAYFDYYQPSCG